MSIAINVFHMLFVAPLFYLIGTKKIEWIIQYLPYLALLIFVTHGVKIVKKKLLQ